MKPQEVWERDFGIGIAGSVGRFDKAEGERLTTRYRHLTKENLDGQMSRISSLLVRSMS
jgi:hypothetical protein